MNGRCERCGGKLAWTDPQMVGCYPKIRKAVALKCVGCWWFKKARFV